MDATTRRMLQYHFIGIEKEGESRLLREIATVALAALYDHLPKEAYPKLREQLTAFAALNPDDDADEALARKTVKIARATLEVFDLVAYQLRSKRCYCYPKIPYAVGLVTEDGEYRSLGKMGCVYGTGLYDFHMEYPVILPDNRAVGFPKALLRVELPDGSRPGIIEYCQTHRITVICTRCDADITCVMNCLCPATS